LEEREVKDLETSRLSKPQNWIRYPGRHAAVDVQKVVHILVVVVGLICKYQIIFMICITKYKHSCSCYRCDEI
jgi:hypothetical protein